MSGLFQRSRRGTLKYATEDLRDREMLPAPDIRWSVHDEGLVLLDVDGGAVYTTNRIGAVIWKGITQKMSPRAISACLSREFGIPADQTQHDTIEFVRELLNSGVVHARS